MAASYPLKKKKKQKNTMKAQLGQGISMGCKTEGWNCGFLMIPLAAGIKRALNSTETAVSSHSHLMPITGSYTTFTAE